MKSKKIVVDYDNIKDYIENKIDLDIDKVSKDISVLEDFIENHHYILNWKKNELFGKQLLLDKLNNLKRSN